MDFEFSPREEALRARVREWLATHYPEGFGRFGEATVDMPDDETWAFARAFAKNLAAQGWLAPGWPVAYGGAGMTPMEQFALRLEFALHDAPPGTGSEAAVDILGPVFLDSMSEDQKARHLPGISAGDVVWCQGYSEPEAGSDLASLRTRAVRDGDEYVVNGTKIWTSFAHRADWILLLVRTDPDAPKWAGISMLMADLRTPGITIQPIENMLGQVTFNQVFLEDVRVPLDHLVGEENHGWKLVTASLESERSLIGSFARASNFVDRLVGHCQEHVDGSGLPLICRPATRRRLADLRIGLEVGRLLSYRVASRTAKGLGVTHEASMVKLFGSELGVTLANDAMSILGAEALLTSTDDRAPLNRQLAEAHQFARVMTVGGGSSEIQRNIIAQRGLGLPRS